MKPSRSLCRRFRKLFICASALLLAHLWYAADGAPFRDLHIPFTQPDGSKIELIGWGDEFYAVFESVEGFTVVFDQGLRAYCFAVQDDNGNLVSSAEPVRAASPSDPGIPKHLRMSKAARHQQAQNRFEKWEAGTGVAKAWKEHKAALRQFEVQTKDGPQLDPPTSTTTGLKVGLTLLIDFDDDPATVPQAEIFNFCNGDEYSGYGNNGSVKKYFQDVSNGLLTYSNVVTVYIRIPNSLHPKSWYNDTSLDCGAQGNKLIADAVSILKALPNYTTDILPAFNTLTVDSQNRVVACNVFYAGGNGGVWSYGLWPHSWSLYDAGAQELSPGGKKLYKYQITNIGNNLAISTFCHENGHMLCGFPDLYDYDYDSMGGAGKFCLMNSGSSGGNPSQVCAYLKRAAGWATTVDLNSTSTLTGSLSAGPGAGFNHFYRYQKPGVPTEYFLLEARYASGRDAILPTSGIAIWHIDELGDRDNQSLIPNTTHENYEVTLVQADNQWHFESDANSGDVNDLYYSQNTAAGYSNGFSDGSSPNANWWDGTASGASFHDFSARASTMTFGIGYADMPPQIVSQPQSRTVIAYHSFVFSVGVLGTSPLSYQWYLAGAPIPGATAASYAIPNPTATDEGDYWVQVTNSLGSATSLSAHLTVLPGVSFEEALDTTNHTWTVGGALGWETETDITHDNADAAQSGSIGDRQESWMETVITGPGTLKFWWKVSSEATFDFLELYIDGTLQGGHISGEVAWSERVVSIPGGEHTVRWSYKKDDSVASGSDRGWVDQVSFTPGAELTLGDAVDAPKLGWTVGGAFGWWGQNGFSHDGIDAGQSGSITHNQTNWMQTVVNGGGTLSFWWSVSSEPNYDYLEFWLDDVRQARISGTPAWQQKTYAVGPGSHTFKWSYTKDVNLSVGSDCGWVDQVSFVPDTVEPPTIGPIHYTAGQIEFSVDGCAGSRYVVLGSTDLVNWEPLCTNTPPFIFTEPEPASPARFYRVRSEP